MALPEPTTTFTVGITAAMDDQTLITGGQVAALNTALAEHAGTFALLEAPEDGWPSQWSVTLVVENMGNPAVALQRAIGLVQTAGRQAGVQPGKWTPLTADVARVEPVDDEG